MAHLHPLTNVPTKYQLPTPYSFRDIARTRFYRSRSLPQDQIKVTPQCCTPTTPSQCIYQVSNSYTLRFLRYIPDNILSKDRPKGATRFYRSRSLRQGQRSNQGHITMLHTYNSQPMYLPSIKFLHFTVSEIYPGQHFIKRQTQRCNKILQVKVTTARSKVKSRSHHDVAYLHPPTNVPTK